MSPFLLSPVSICDQCLRAGWYQVGEDVQDGDGDAAWRKVQDLQQDLQSRVAQLELKGYTVTL